MSEDKKLKSGSAALTSRRSFLNTAAIASLGGLVACSENPLPWQLRQQDRPVRMHRQVRILRI
jgi:hypothetical protein